MEHLEQHLPHSECTEEHGILLILKKFPALSHKAPIFVPASSSHCPSVFLTKLLFICPFSSHRSAHLYHWPLSCYLSAYLALISCSLPVSIPPRPLHPHPPSRFGYLLAICLAVWQALGGSPTLPITIASSPSPPTSGTSLAEPLPLPISLCPPVSLPRPLLEPPPSTTSRQPDQVGG